MIDEHARQEQALRRPPEGEEHVAVLRRALAVVVAALGVPAMPKLEIADRAITELVVQEPRAERQVGAPTRYL